MTYCTPTTTQAARIQHRCDWCGETIEPGEVYKRWRCFGDSVCTVKAHPECLDAAKRTPEEQACSPDEVVFNMDQSRGCSCAHWRDCPVCAARAKEPA